MAKTGTEVRSALRKRASKISSTDFLYIFNHLIKNDIKNDVYVAFSEEFKTGTTATIVAATYSYTIASDYYDVISVKDAGGNELRRLYEPDDEPSSNTSKLYWIVGNKIYFPKQQIDDGIYTGGDVITITYYKKIADITAEADNLPYEDFTQDELYPVYVAGMEFFYFGRRKKITDQALARNDYQSAKINAFSRFM